MNTMLTMILTAFLSGNPAAAIAQPAEADAMKADLVGHCMGGREKCWSFQSEAQIRGLEIVGRNLEASQRRYRVRLELADRRVPGRYRAEADVIYRLADGRWSIWCVGLRSMQQVR